MKRVTKQEVKEALEKNPMTKEYGMCNEGLGASKLTEEEDERYASLVCGSCGSEKLYIECKQPSVYIHNSLDDANKEADRLAALELDKKVLVLKVINTRVAKSKIEYERS